MATLLDFCPDVTLHVLSFLDDTDLVLFLTSLSKSYNDHFNVCGLWSSLHKLKQATSLWRELSPELDTQRQCADRFRTHHKVCSTLKRYEALRSNKQNDHIFQAVDTHPLLSYFPDALRDFYLKYDGTYPINCQVEGRTSYFIKGKQMDWPPRPRYYSPTLPLPDPKLVDEITKELATNGFQSERFINRHLYEEERDSAKLRLFEDVSSVDLVPDSSLLVIGASSHTSHKDWSFINVIYIDLAGEVSGIPGAVCSFDYCEDFAPERITIGDFIADFNNKEEYVGHGYTMGPNNKRIVSDNFFVFLESMYSHLCLELVGTEFHVW